jgi:hypothetical protein
MRLWRIAKEMHYAVTRLTELRLSRSAGLNRPPDTYAEFLLLTSTTWRREPSAEQRGRGCTAP